jgi:phosphopantothenoylcysteine decarboxylase/phosphopantothenate--cysteine ligase
MVDQMTTEKRRVLLGVSGSIAAYKSAELARLLVSRGYEVRVVMTPAATEFITPLTLQSVTGHPVALSLWEESSVKGIGHIHLADWADAMVVAPATADTIAKLAAGFAENSLLAMALATRAPLLVAPAMNVNMFEHPATQENIALLRKRGVAFVEPEEGALACGWNGTGRLADPEEIFQHVRRVVSTQDLSGKRVLITTGPTREPLDPVRFLSNRSSGKMGTALAREAFRRGAHVTLVHGPAPVKVPSLVECLPVTTAEEMFQAVMARVFNGEESPDIVIMAAAVADFKPTQMAPTKMKKSGLAPAPLELISTRDILSELGERRGEVRKPILVGFAVETGELDELLVQVRDKLKRKNADMIVGNLAADAFDLDTNRVWLVDRNGRQDEIATTFKGRVANRILDAVLRLE